MLAAGGSTLFLASLWSCSNRSLSDVVRSLPVLLVETPNPFFENSIFSGLKKERNFSSKSTDAQETRAKEMAKTNTLNDNMAGLNLQTGISL